MATKIIRKTASIFAGGLTSGSQQVEQFGSKIVTGLPLYTVDPAIIQGLSSWADGWKPALNPTNNSEYLQDRNAVDLVASYQIAYILQQGIAEWDSGTTYFTDSFCTYNGNLYISLVDNNIGQVPPSSGATTYWQLLSLPLSVPQPTRTVIGGGSSGIYTPPAGCLAITVQMIGGGGGGAGGGTGAGAGGNGNNSTFGSFTAAAGEGGTLTGVGGLGGVASGGSLNINGASGQYPTQFGIGGAGASSYFGGAGAPGGTAGSGFPGSANSGAGGGGAATQTAGGGGAGAYIEFSINNPGTIAYSIGAGGAAGAGSYPGGAGGSGNCIITEYYF